MPGWFPNAVLPVPSRPQLKNAPVPIGLLFARLRECWLNPVQMSVVAAEFCTEAGRRATGTLPVVMMEPSKGGTDATGSTPATMSLADPEVAMGCSSFVRRRICSAFKYAK